ncbi:hypothetical protein ACA910_016674 [Epithemia clementina (nom. ined.)]
MMDDSSDGSSSDACSSQLVESYGHNDNPQNYSRNAYHRDDEFEANFYTTNDNGSNNNNNHNRVSAPGGNDDNDDDDDVTYSKNGWTGEKLQQSSYKDLGSPSDVEDRFYRHCLNISNTRVALQRLLLQPFSTTTRDYSIPIRAYDFLQEDPVLGHLLLRYPATLLPVLEKAVVRAQIDLLQQMQAKFVKDKDGGNENDNDNDNDNNGGGNDNDMDPDRVAAAYWQSASVKGGPSHGGAGAAAAAATRVHARLVHLPPSRFKSSLSRLEARDVGQMWQVSGTVVRASPVQMYESARTYQCQIKKASAAANNNNTKSKRTKPNNHHHHQHNHHGDNGGSSGCGRTFVVHANLEQYNNALTPPDACPLLLSSSNGGGGGDGNKKQPCRGTNLVAMDPSIGSVHTDYQEIKIQESSSSTGSKIGHIPRSLLVKLEHDLVDLCQPGDQVVVVGSLLAQWQSDVVVNTKQAPKNIRDSAEPDIGLALLAHSILVLSDERSSSSSSSSMTMDASSNGGGLLSSALDENKRYSAEFERYWQTEAHRPIYARDYICRAVCPKLYGLPVIKLALLLTLIGGVSADSVPDPTNEKHVDTSNSNNNNNNNDLRIFSQQEQEEPTERSVPLDGADLFMIPHRRDRRHMSQDQVDYSPYNDGNDNRHQQGRGENPGTTTSLRNTPSQAVARSASQVEPVASVGEKTGQRASRLPNHHSSSSSSAQVYTRRRSQSHLLLVGDPGTGKSQFLRFAAALSPRAVLTTGVGTTSAGLTCAAVRHGASGEFALEAGALVLADQGVCCIDEFGCIRDQDRTTIHEAMEQQHLSVAKAGIVCKLNCRATIIAVMNPKDCLYDNQCSLSVNTGLGTPLLSRFDLIFKLVDSSDATRDDNITTYLLNQAMHGSGCGSLLLRNDGNEMPSLFLPDPWPMEKLRAYIAIVKEKICPVLSDEAAVLLERHYEACRASKSRTIPVTVRFLESLIRLSQAHARLLYRDNVLLIDAVAVIRVMECSAFCYGGFDCPSSYDHDDHGNLYHQSLYSDPVSMDFSDEPDLDLCCFEFHILKRYQMLDYMAEDRRRQAEDAIHGKAMQSQQTQSWADIEGSYGAEWTNTSVPNQWDGQLYPVDDLSSNTPTNPTQQRRSALTEIRDHYGRSYYSQVGHEASVQHSKKRKKM